MLSEHARRKVHAGTISRYERGRLVPTARILHAYCAGLGLDASELLRLAAAD
ncbi:MAG: helix-turn-helix domain-containing protein [Miltoncostaeaceae bacterium]